MDESLTSSLESSSASDDDGTAKATQKDASNSNSGASKGSAKDATNDPSSRKDTEDTIKKGAAEDAHKGASKDTPKEASNDTPKDASKDTTKEASKDTPKDASKGTTKEASKDTPKDASKGTASDHSKTPPKGILKESPVSTSKDASKRDKKVITDGASKLTFADPAAKGAAKADDLMTVTMTEAQTAQAGTEEDDISMPVLLQPMCPRELLLSKECTSQLAVNNGIKGRISFFIVTATVVLCLLGHGISLSLTSNWFYWKGLESLLKFSFPHVRTPCAVIMNLDTTQGNLSFYDIPYASFTHRFEESHMVETFQDCYWHYYLLSDKRLASFKNGAFFWDYDVMMQLHSDRSAWRLQPKQPGAAETTGHSERLSLSIITPTVSGRRPVVVLVTGYDFTVNKPVLPGPDVVGKLDCVVVTVNYRLGLDGAAVLNRENYMGNLFARDVTQALAWLNHTVETFGGDAKKIVYLGQGSGATLGLWIMVSPEAVFVHRFWLIDPSVEIPALSEFGSMVEDIFLQDPSPLKAAQEQIDICYNQFKHMQPASCLNSAVSEVLRITPKWMTEIYNYLDQFPEQATRNKSERSLLHLPPSMLNGSLLFNLRAGSLKLADKAIVFHSSSASNFYPGVFPLGRWNASRFRVETALRESLERVYIQRNSRNVGSAIVQQYVNLMKVEVNEDEIDYEEVRRMVLYDIRTLCPIQALVYHLVIRKIIRHPVYNLLDLSSYQSVPIVIGSTDMHCDLPRFMIHDFNDAGSGACRLAFDVGDEGRRQLRSYRTFAIGMLSDFAHGRDQSEHHPHYMAAAVGDQGGEGFDAHANLIDHRGNMPGMDTKRSQVIKTVCHELYGPLRNDWHALLYMARYN